MASTDTIESTTNPSEVEEHQIQSPARRLLRSLAATLPKCGRAHDRINLQPVSQYSTTPVNNDNADTEQEPLVASRYELNRSQQEMLMNFANIFRLMVIFALIPIIYYFV